MSDTTTAPPGAGLPARAPGLRPPEHRVDPRAVRYWTLRALGGWLLLAAGLTALQQFGPDRTARPALLVLACALPAAAAHLALMPRRRYAVHRWETTADAICVRTGWLVEEWRIAPIARVQTVDHERGPLERRLGLTTVTVTTASSAGPLKIRGLAEGTAAELAAALTEAARSGTGDAT
ncbi:PH domain-containing protein [Streptomyces sp. TLI_171]|uniref:PH domain-containing protein n=1 Tax=Streptomyces sp. TLI_171 TaxID=1938859 RepID=UPI000C181359|nr:PH domain-containing protein [Streptomyces sp. TLI_171]RKE21278.1 hypothetical protein BX266_4658 [Streptomyces sp. TLI_171]